MSPKHSPQPLALRTREAAQALGISERMLQELTATGDVPVVKIGRANLYPIKELTDWLSSRAKEQSATNNIGASAVDCGH